MDNAARSKLKKAVRQGDPGRQFALAGSLKKAGKHTKSG
jgi:hypothetical protein